MVNGTPAGAIFGARRSLRGASVVLFEGLFMLMGQQKLCVHSAFTLGELPIPTLPNTHASSLHAAVFCNFSTPGHELVWGGLVKMGTTAARGE